MKATAAPTPIHPRLVAVEYVEQLTGYSRYTIYRMAREGRIPAVRNGRSIRFDPAALDKWIDKMPKASA